MKYYEPYFSRQRVASHLYKISYCGYDYCCKNLIAYYSYYCKAFDKKK